jgi:hypothetical protein
MRLCRETERDMERPKPRRRVIRRGMPVGAYQVSGLGNHYRQ